MVESGGLLNLPGRFPYSRIFLLYRPIFRGKTGLWHEVHEALESPRKIARLGTRRHKNRAGFDTLFGLVPTLAQDPGRTGGATLTNNASLFRTGRFESRAV